MISIRNHPFGKWSLDIETRENFTTDQWLVKIRLIGEQDGWLRKKGLCLRLTKTEFEQITPEELADTVEQIAHKIKDSGWDIPEMGTYPVVAYSNLDNQIW